MALQQAELDPELQDGFLLLVDSLVQVGVFVLEGNNVNTLVAATNDYFSN